jgi:uncharacterized repeat protein (TIGR03803 family)
MRRSFTKVLANLSGTGVLLVALYPALAAQQTNQSATQKTLYSFTGPSGDGLFPTTALIQDSQGNFYGTTSEGAIAGSSACAPLGCGMIFKLSSAGKESIVHAFPGGHGGIGPNGLVMDSAGNLYGTTVSGGNSLFPGGIVFKIDPTGKKTTLHTFSGPDGRGPTSTLLLDSSGNLYGTTTSGGKDQAGVVFKLDASGTYTRLYQFTGGVDGANPNRSRLLLDSEGNLYGLTYSGGLGNGTLFKLTPSGQESTLYSFTGGNDGGNPLGDLVQDGAGNFYGVTYAGGANGNGVVFRVNSGGQETVLYTFGAGLKGHPQSGVLLDSAGNLYGTTTFGGIDNRGSVYKLSSTGTFTVLRSFSGGADGGRPYGGLLMGLTGDLYGTTIDGGTNQAGAVYSLGQ